MFGFLVSFNWQADYIEKVKPLFHLNLDDGTKDAERIIID